jgi:hypothetical protein
MDHGLCEDIKLSDILSALSFVPRLCGFLLAEFFGLIEGGLDCSGLQHTLVVDVIKI